MTLELWNAYVEREVEPLLRAGYRPAQLLSGFARYAALPTARADAQAGLIQTDDQDAMHPSLAARLPALATLAAPDVAEPPVAAENPFADLVPVLDEAISAAWAKGEVGAESPAVTWDAASDVAREGRVLRAQQTAAALAKVLRTSADDGLDLLVAAAKAAQDPVPFVADALGRTVPEADALDLAHEIVGDLSIAAAGQRGRTVDVEFGAPVRIAKMEESVDAAAAELCAAGVHAEAWARRLMEGPDAS